MASSFSRQRNPNMEKALFDWPVMLQYDVKVKYRLISRKFFGHEERLLNQTKATHVCIRSINQSNRSIPVRFVVRGLFVRFHVKVLRKSLYPYQKDDVCLSTQLFQNSLEISLPKKGGENLFVENSTFALIKSYFETFALSSRCRASIDPGLTLSFLFTLISR